MDNFKRNILKIRKKWGRLSHMQILAVGFLLIILTGTLILMLPVSSRDGTVTSFTECLFTATSATCVTGLVVVDTCLHWSLFGQIVILLMIQTGGLGFMSIGVFFSVALHRKVTMRQRGILTESLNAIQIGGIVRMMRKICFGTLLVEGAGAALLSIRFCQEHGFLKGIYYGVFHSVSAFCNAGFDLMGYQGAYSSMVGYSADWLVNLTLVALILIGGIGFLVWDDITVKKWKFARYRLHTKLVLLMTVILVGGGTLLFYLFERNHLAAGMGPGETFLTCLFDAVTPRTAGFNTTDIAGLSDAGKLLSLILMFIGGNPGSTAGGIKTTTALVFILYMWSNVTKSRGMTVFHKRIDGDAIKRASTVASTNLMLALIAMLVICGMQPLDLRDVALETISAISTVGMSTGITRDLNEISRFAIIILMFCGRVGSLSILVSFTEKRKVSAIEYPEEKILIG